MFLLGGQYCTKWISHCTVCLELYSLYLSLQCVPPDSIQYTVYCLSCILHTVSIVYTREVFNKLYTREVYCLVFTPPGQPAILRLYMQFKLSTLFCRDPNVHLKHVLMLSGEQYTFVRGGVGYQLSHGAIQLKSTAQQTSET